MPDLIKKMNSQFDVLIDSYLQDKIGIAPMFLNRDLSMGLQQHILQLQKDEMMTAAGIRNEKERDAHQKKYLRTGISAIGRRFYWSPEQNCYTGINAYEFHYAVYEEGSFYKRHRDQFKMTVKGNIRLSII